MVRNAVVAIERTTVREQIQTVLVRQGFTVHPCADGQEAAEQLDAASVALLICDDALRGRSGLELCADVRDHQPNARSIIFFGPDKSAKARAELTEGCGADACFGPSFDAGELLRLLDTWQLTTPQPAFTPSFSFAVPARPVSDTDEPAPAKAPSPAPAPPTAAIKPPVVPSAMPMRAPPLTLPRTGDLAQQPLPRLLFQLYVSTFSGTLRLIRQGAEADIGLSAGIPVFVASQALEDTLGAVLEERGAIDRGQLQRAQSVSVDKGLRLGQALMELGHVSEEQLLDAIRLQTERKLARLFSWRVGEYVLSDEPPYDSDAILSELDPLITSTLR